MNARSHIFELAVESCQVEDAVLALLHPVLVHRALGKFSYQVESSYSIGTVGYQDVDCHAIDHTYVRTSSPGLDSLIRREVLSFAEDLKNTHGIRSGQISLEFYQRKRTRWPFPPENIPWEVWTIRVELVTLQNEYERIKWREKLGEVLSEKTLYVTEVMNKHEFLPKMPNQSELELVFDTSFHDVQPYLFKACHSTSSPSTPSVGINTVRRLLKDTLAI
jgi:autophagy-related protein 101